MTAVGPLASCAQPEDKLRFLAPVSPKPELPLFVYLPGMDGTGELFYTQTPKLASRVDIRCLRIPPNDRSDWSALVAGTIRLIKAELNQRENSQVYLCGESFGGCLSLKLALEAPELLSYLILINPASSFRHNLWVQWGSCLTQWIPQLFYSSSVLGLLPLLASLGHIAPRERQALIGAMRSVPQATSVWRMDLLRGFERDIKRLGQLQIPTLVIAGKRDLLLPSIIEAELLAQCLPNVQTAILPQSGHACLLEAHVDLYEILQKYQVLVDTQALASDLLEAV
ncbi:MAG: alpha/beta fold hydrolase [Microcoleaceae cyanobacterium]